MQLHVFLEKGGKERFYTQTERGCEDRLKKHLKMVGQKIQLQAKKCWQKS